MSKIKEGALEEKWRSYTGTGIVAEKAGSGLALRESVGGGEFAIVEIKGDFLESSPIQVLEEIPTSSRKEAERRFDEAVEMLGFRKLGLRALTL